MTREYLYQLFYGLSLALFIAGFIALLRTNHKNQNSSTTYIWIWLFIAAILLPGLADVIAYVVF